jgi:hypothetical protein
MEGIGIGEEKWKKIEKGTRKGMREGWERDWREERERGLIRRKGKGWKEEIKKRTGTGIGENDRNMNQRGGRERD